MTVWDRVDTPVRSRAELISTEYAEQNNDVVTVKSHTRIPRDGLFRRSTGEYPPLALVTLGRTPQEIHKARCHGDIGLFSWKIDNCQGLVAEMV